MLGNYKVGARLTAGFAIAAALTAVTGLVGFTGLRSIGAAADDLGRSQLPSVESLGSVEAGQASVIVAERALANPLLVRPELRQAQYAFIEKNMAAAEAALAVYDKIPRDSAEDASYRDLVSTWADWKAKHGEVVSMSQDKDRLLASGAKLSDPRIRAMDTRTFETSLSSREAFLAVRANLDKLIKSADTQAASASAAATAASRRATTILILFVLAAAGLAAAMGVALTRSITQPLKGMSEAADRIALGDVEQTLEHHSQDELGKLADAFRALISYITDISHAADALARGDLSVEPKPRSADDALSANMGRAIGALRLMVADTGRLAIAGREGELATRADASVHEGDYRRIVQGVNDTLDAVIGPLNVTAECVDRISKGDIPAKITDNYNGDFNHIKNNLNAC
ncbi:MAG TPA: HAMP domain-containing protein, partial [Armatimonadota bacterium]